MSQCVKQACHRKIDVARARSHVEEEVVDTIEIESWLAEAEKREDGVGWTTGSESQFGASSDVLLTVGDCEQKSTISFTTASKEDVECSQAGMIHVCSDRYDNNTELIIPAKHTCIKNHIVSHEHAQLPYVN